MTRALDTAATLQAPATNQHVAQDCRSPEGITTGLIDALISIYRILAKRDLSVAYDALLDLISDEDFTLVHETAAAAAQHNGPDQ